RADVRATFRRQAGREDIEKHYAIQFKHASILYDQFPYPLEEVTGELLLSPGHWECRNFRGRHAGGEMLVGAHSSRASKTNGGAAPAPEVQVSIRGTNILRDHEFERALTPIGSEGRRNLRQAWRALQLSGRLSFAAEVTDKPGLPQDIDVRVNIQGC